MPEDTLGTAKVAVRADTSKLGPDFDAAKQQVAGHMGGIGQIVAGVAGGTLIAGAFQKLASLGVEAIGALRNEIGELLERGDQVGDVSDAFDTLTQSIGTDTTTAITALRGGVQGLVTDFDLMAATNKAIRSGVQGTEADFKLVGQAARILSESVGGDTTQAFNDLMGALQTGRTKGLTATYGATVELKGAMAGLKDQLAETGDQVTTAADVEAKRTAILETLRSVVEQSGEAEVGFAEKIDQGKVVLSNFVDQLSAAIVSSPVLSTALLEVSNALGAAFGSSQQGLIETIVGVINQVAIHTITVGQVAVTVAGLVDRVWNGIKLPFLSLASVILLVVEGVVKVAAGLNDMASHIPGVGDKFKGLAADAHSMADWLGGAQRSMHDQAAEALAGVKGNNAFHQTLGKISDGLTRAQANLILASQAGEQHAKTIDKVRGAHDQAAPAVNANAETIKKLAGTLRDIGNQYDAAVAHGVNMSAFMEKNAKGFLDAGLDAQTYGVKIEGSFARAYEAAQQYSLAEALEKNRADMAKVLADILKDRAAHEAKVTDLINTAWLSNQGAIVQAEQDATTAAEALESDSLEKRLRILHREYDAKRAGVNKFADNYKEAIAGWDAAEAASAEKVKKDFADAMAANVAATDTWSERLDALGSTFQQLSQIAGGSFSGIAQTIGTVISSINLAVKSGQQFADALKEMKGSGGLTGGEGGVAGAFNAIAGIAQMVPLIGGMIAGVVSGIKAIVGAFSKPEYKKYMASIGTEWGVTIGENTAKAIEASAATMSHDAAKLFNLDKIIADAGGLTSKNFDLFAGKLRDVFALTGRGGMSQADATATIDKVFKQYVAAAEQIGPPAMAKIKEIIALDKQFGTDSAAIGEYVKTTLGAVVSGLGDYLAVHDAAARSVEELKRQLNDESLSEAKRLALTKQLTQQQRLLTATSITSQESATAMAAAVTASFAEMLDRGMSFTEAVNAVSPAVSSLSEQLKAAGLDGGAAFADLRKYVDLASDAVAGPALDAVAGLGRALQDLDTTGLLTNEMFRGLTGQIAKTYDTLVKQGKDGPAILRSMQPQLQQMWEKWKDTGWEIDDNTRKMLADAEAAGVVGDAHRSANDRIATGIERVGDILETVFADKLPKALKTTEDAVGGVSDAVSRIPREFTIYGEVIYDPGEPPTPPSHQHGDVISRTHRAVVHAGEIVGPVDFMARALAGALDMSAFQALPGLASLDTAMPTSTMPLSLAGSGQPLVVQVMLPDGRVLAEATVPHIPLAIRQLGVF